MVGTITAALQHIQAELATLLDAPTILALCREMDSQWRERPLDPVTTIHLFLLQILHGNTACTHLPHLSGQRFTASAYCQARTRVPLGVLEPLLRRTSAVCEQTTHDEGRWRGHRTFLVDGSSFSRPDTPERQEECGQPSGQQPGCGFPVAHLLAVFHADTGFVLEALAAPWHPHDMAEVATLHTALRPGDVLVGDRAFCAFAHVALLRQHDLHAVFRVHQRHIVDFTPSRPHPTPKPSTAQQGLPRSRWLRQLGGTDQLGEWVKPVRLPTYPPEWRTPQVFAALPAVLCVRELRYRVTHAGFRTQTVTLVTTLLDIALYPADALAALYGTRWQVESNLRHLKQTMGLQQFPEESKTPSSLRGPNCHFVNIYATICPSSQPLTRFFLESVRVMAIPQTHQYLSADALLGLLRRGFAALPEHRAGKPSLALPDVLMSAFAMFSLKLPSLLAFDRERTEGNVQRVYGIERVPCDTAMREILDPVEPEGLRPLFTHIFGALQRSKALEKMVFVAGHYLVAFDGTGYFSSQQIHCDSCLERHHRNGTITYAHQMLGAVLIHPDRRAVIPLMPEPIVKHDGTEKNDCERHAAKRLIAKLRQDHPHLKLIVTEDSLSSNAPHIRVLQDHQLHYILGVKEGDHAFLFAHVAAAEQAGRVTYYDREDVATGVRHRFRFLRDVPLNEAHADLRVNFLECWEWDGDQEQHFSWVTDLRVTKGTVYQIMRGGRARWRIENETFNTLKNQGYHYEHNYGHGYHHLSVVFAVLMMLAFLVDQVQQLCCPLFQAVWSKLGSKRRLWERMRALFYDYALDSMRQLFEALFCGWKKTAPILIVDSS